MCGKLAAKWDANGVQMCGKLAVNMTAKWAANGLLMGGKWVENWLRIVRQIGLQNGL